VQKDCRLGKRKQKHVQFVSFDWFPLVKIVRALTSDGVGKWRMNHPMINMIVVGDSVLRRLLPSKTKC